MPEETNGSTSPTRLDRIERIVEVLANVMHDLQQEQRVLMTAQVVMSDEIRKLAVAQKTSEEHIQQLADAQKHADGRMDALILTVDEIVRGKKQP